ncbi:MAG: SDR family NAD(P)-dependent oxidoreductase, partial [Phenylobacterium sp.]
MHGAGAQVVLADINADKLAAAAELLGDRALPVVVDVREPDQISAALERGRRAFGPVRVAVSCAGILSAAKIVSRGQAHDLDVWRRVLDVNLTGTFNVLRLAAAHMIEAPPDPDTGERGVIVNTASIAAFDGQKGQAAYAASKAGVVGLTL